MDHTVAYCGVDCLECGDYQDGTCVSCRLTEWKENEICMPVKGCREKGIEFCARCGIFPCESMTEFYMESDSHREAYRRMCAVNKKSKNDGCR